MAPYTLEGEQVACLLEDNYMVAHATTSVGELLVADQYRATRRRPLWYRFVLRQLDAIEQLSPGWDSHGCDAPDLAAIDAGRDLLRHLLNSGLALPKPQVNPTPNGGVQFSWEIASRYFELETVSANSARFFYEDDSTATEECGIVRIGQPLNEVLGCLRQFAQ